MSLRPLLASIALLAAGLLAGPACAQVKWNVGFVNAVGSSYVDTIKTVPARIEAATQEKMSGVMGGMQLPPGMKLPF